MFFSFEISAIVIILLAVAAAGVTAVVMYCFLRVIPVARSRREADGRTDEVPDDGFEPATIIVYSQDEAEALQELLPALLRQDYPAAFEIIVVNEGDSPEVRDTVAMFRDPGNNLYVTYTPDGARNLSRKKLALTLGIKAARFPLVVLTCADTVVESDLWLRRITRGLAGGADIVLGYAYPRVEEDEGMWRRTRSFDFASDSVRWISAALRRRAFRGDGHNLAYRRDLFFANRGFSRSLNLHWGDDDIFISEIACGRTVTAVELSADSMTAMRGGATARAHRERLARRAFTEKFIHSRPRFFRSISDWCAPLAFCASVAACILSVGNWFAIAIAGVLIAFMWTVQIMAWRNAMVALRCRPLCVTVPWIAATAPVRRLWRNISGRLHHGKQYTWD